MRAKNFKLAAIAALFVLANLANSQPVVRAQLDLSNLGGGSSLGDDAEKVLATAYFTAPAGDKPAMLHVTADITPGWHIYSTTQAAGGPVKTRIKVTASPAFKLIGEFKAAKAPEIHEYPDAWPGLKVEEHEGSVTWSAPVEFAADTDLANLKIAGAIYAQVCAKDCLLPTDYKFTAKLKGAAPAKPVAAAAPQGSEKYAGNLTHVTLTGAISPATAAPGSVAKLTITADPQPGYHIYAWAKQVPDVPGSLPTLIVLTDSAGLQFAEPKADTKPEEGTAGPNEKAYYYSKPVTWSIDLKVPDNAQAGSHLIRGIIGYQTCKDTSCDPPHGAWFEGTLAVGEKSSSDAAKLSLRAGKYAEARKLSEGKPLAPVENSVAPPPKDNSSNSSAPLPQFTIHELNSSSHESLALVLASALLGGFILNFMPCVLPVIGLKILSFVEQSGHDRRRVLMLNIWYSLGLLCVFLVLAALASAASLGLQKENLAWGEQFNSTAFNIVMSGVVFAMALSFLGVWEIPIPGFAGSGNAAKLATKEGVMGAFAKGALSTVLATPCSGPLLGSVFGFTLRQPPAVTFAIFGTIGLGMASPYLLIGAFPQLIKFLPKPGAWMDTFKHIMGFVLLGTVVFLFTFLKSDYLVPTFGMLIGIWAACWWIGRVSLTAELPTKLRAWAVGLATAGVVGWVSFTVLVQGGHDGLPWQPFTPDALAKYSKQGKTIMVDFTASWCLSCKTNLKFAINTDDVLKKVKQNDVVPLLADFSDMEAATDVKEMLEALNSKSIPVLALFPADRPGEVLILRDLISKSQVLGALQAAGPSKPESLATGTAMN